MEVMARLEAALAEITGMDAVTLQPAAGAHGELTGILLIRALLEKRGNPRKKILIPDSAHGTNPATAAIAGYAVENIKSSETGVLDVAALERIVDEDVAALMVTNPNTLGVFEENIVHAAEILHAKGALLYMDGANMNALVGIARPGDFGVDVMHLNLHKTFSTPHGGGGPGAGPVAVKKALEPFLPVPRLKRSGKKWAWDYERPQSIGRVKAFYGNFGVLVRALAYILAHGGPGLRNATVDAVLNANYIRKKLEPYYDLPYAHAEHARSGVQRRPAGEAGRAHGRYRQAADRLRLPSVHGELPADRARRADDRADRDREQAGAGSFIDAMISIAKEVESDPQMVKKAPHGTRTSRVDEVTAARKPVLRWKALEGPGRPAPSRSRLCELWIILGLVLLIRLPFLNQAIQGDDHIYLTEAAHALIEPLHPNNFRTCFWATRWICAGIRIRR